MIIKAKNSYLVDITGIILLESKNTFKLLVKDGSIKGMYIWLFIYIISSLLFISVVPKNYCIFEVKLGGYRITCYGEQFTIKPYERFSKKIKKIVPPRDINTVKI